MRAWGCFWLGRWPRRALWRRESWKRSQKLEEHDLVTGYDLHSVGVEYWIVHEVGLPAQKRRSMAEIMGNSNYQVH